MGFERYSIQDLGLINNLDNHDFDHITKAAASALGTKISVFSVLDRENERELYQSPYGIDKELPSYQGVPLSHSFCKYVVADNTPLIVDDAPSHPRVKDNPSTKKIGHFAYLGVPVHVPEGDAIGALCVVDPKPRKWTEQEINIIRSLGRCVEDLIRMKSALMTSESLRTEQSQISYAMSHDIKGPISTLRMLLAELSNHSEDKDEHDVFLDKALNATQRMEQTTSDILKYASSIEGEIKFQTLDVADVINETIDGMSDEIAQSGAQISVSTMPKIIGNEGQLKILIQNILSNAIKFQPEGQTPVIDISWLDAGFENMIYIADNGIGIERKYQGRIFKLFSRLHTRRDYPGSGLGLALCSRIVSNLNGRIVLQSEPDKGSTFIIKIPKSVEMANEAD